MYGNLHRLKNWKLFLILLTLTSHVQSTVNLCGSTFMINLEFDHLSPTATILVQVTTISHLDCQNKLPNGPPVSVLDFPQTSLNTIARVLLLKPKSEYISLYSDSSNCFPSCLE